MMVPEQGAMTESSAVMGELKVSLAAAGEGRRDDILVKIADLFEGVSHLLDEGSVDTFGLIFVSLIPVCSEQAKAHLSDAIAPNPRAPGMVIRHLAFDDSILVARPVIRLSPLLLDEHLLALATVKSPAHLLAMCERASLASGVTDVILSRANGEIMVALAANAGARFSERGRMKLAEAALDDGGLYDVVVKREDLANGLEAGDGAGLWQGQPTPAGFIPSAHMPAAHEGDEWPAPQPADALRAGSGPQVPETDRLLRELLAEDKIDAAIGALAHKLGFNVQPVAKAFSLDIHGGFLTYARAVPLTWDTTLRFLMKRYAAGHVTPRLERSQADFQRLAVNDARRVASLLAEHGSRPT
jgi:hypothetical protein